MVRNARSTAAQRNIWAQIGVSACVLLLPPVALGAAVYSMLPARDDGAVHHVADTVADAHAAATEFRPAEPQLADAPAPAATPKPLAAAAQPVPTTGAPSSFSLASARQEPKMAAKDTGNKDTASKKDAARVMGPVPVRVTVVVAPPATEVDSAPTGSIDPEPRVAAVEAPAALMPPVREPLTQMPAIQAPATQVPVVHAPAAEPPTAEAPPGPRTAPTARQHVRFSYLRHLARRNGARAEARSEARTEVRPAARPNADSQNAFSLRNWLYNLNTRQRPARS